MNIRRGFRSGAFGVGENAPHHVLDRAADPKTQDATS
jgi:hypothetical protein